MGSAGWLLCTVFLCTVVAPSCAGRSISRDPGKDGDTGGIGGSRSLPPDGDDVDDDDILGGGTGGSATAGVGAGAAGGTRSFGGAYPTGGESPYGGNFPVGGAFPDGGTGISNGGSVASGGTAGSAGIGNQDPECKGIKSNMACPIEGKQCPDLVCGLADSGRRSCTCATNWVCTSCDYTNSPFKDRPLDIQQCPPDAADEAPCLNQNVVCGPVGSEYCACYFDARDGALAWDCDSPPPTWMAF